MSTASASTTGGKTVEDAAGGGTGLVVGRVDALLGERARSSGEFLAGLIAAGELATAGTPRLLPADLFPGADPVLVRAVWDRALAVGLHAGRVSRSPRFHRDELARLQQELEAVGFRAMGGLVGRSLRLVAPASVERVEPGPAGGRSGLTGCEQYYFRHEMGGTGQMGRSNGRLEPAPENQSVARLGGGAPEKSEAPAATLGGGPGLRGQDARADDTTPFPDE